MCVNPYIARTKDGKHIPVPCGKCLDCRKAYQTEWTFRLLQESKRTPVPAFVTLTYSDDYMPLACDVETGELKGVVQKRDIQLFFKRLRKIGGSLTENLRYYAIAEYGSKYNRPHYHAIIICPNLRYISDLDKLIKRAWPFGFSLVKLSNRKSIQYLCKYMNKIDERPHLEPPFRLYSRSIGLNYLSQKMIDYYLTSFDRTCISGNARIGLPRYYKRKLDELSQGVPSLKISGLTYSDLLEDIQPKENSKYWFLKDFAENFEKYYIQACVHVVKSSECDGHEDRVCIEVSQPTPQRAWQMYVRTHKILQDIIFEDERALNDCKIRNGIIGDKSTDYNVDVKILTEV